MTTWLAAVKRGQEKPSSHARGRAWFGIAGIHAWLGPTRGVRTDVRGPESLGAVAKQSAFL